MKPIYKYLSTKIKNSNIKATNKDFVHILITEIKRLGPDADLNHIDVSDVTNMYDPFYWNNEHFNCDISKWNVSNVTMMQEMFLNCVKFNCDISEWDVHNVKNMSKMFYKCTSFNQDLSSWDVSNVINNVDMFGGMPLREEYKPHFVK